MLAERTECRPRRAVPSRMCSSDTSVSVAKITLIDMRYIEMIDPDPGKRSTLSESSGVCIGVMLFEAGTGDLLGRVLVQVVVVAKKLKVLYFSNGKI